MSINTCTDLIQILFCCFRGIPCAIITVLYAPSPGRSHTRRQRPSRLWTNVLPRWHQKRTNFNLVGVEFGRHGAAVEVELSSAWLVRVSDEPAVGTTDYCYTFTAKGRKKDRVSAQAVFIITASIARWRVLGTTYCVSGRVKPFGSNHYYLRKRGGYLTVSH